MRKSLASALMIGCFIAEQVDDIICGIAALYDAPLREEAIVLDDYVGPGYGIDSPESTAALELVARTEGLLLDPVYSAKAMAGLLDWIRQGRLTAADTVLFWHTGGQLALFYNQNNNAYAQSKFTDLRSSRAQLRR
jgi:1-aminocyclopropane-1-carboxylate deaminase/D-cysteine desulfhydrase-like pyridoxal-dependent ACC family enzyme